MNTTKNMTLAEWETEYKPIVNPYTADLLGDGGYLWETFGDELTRIQETANNLVWTLIDTDTGTVIIEGYHLVDRVGYYITEKPWQPHTEYHITVGTWDDEGIDATPAFYNALGED